MQRKQLTSWTGYWPAVSQLCCKNAVSVTGTDGETAYLVAYNPHMRKAITIQEPSERNSYLRLYLRSHQTGWISRITILRFILVQYKGWLASGYQKNYIPGYWLHRREFLVSEIPELLSRGNSDLHTMSLKSKTQSSKSRLAYADQVGSQRTSVHCSGRLHPSWLGKVSYM